MGWRKDENARFAPGVFVSGSGVHVSFGPTRWPSTAANESHRLRDDRAPVWGREAKRLHRSTACAIVAGLRMLSMVLTRSHAVRPAGISRRSPGRLAFHGHRENVGSETFQYGTGDISRPTTCQLLRRRLRHRELALCRERRCRSGHLPAPSRASSFSCAHFISCGRFMKR